MWLGYPGSSGASYMDYIVTDRVTSPLQLAEHYSEKLAYMPNTFFIGDHSSMFPHLLFKGQGSTNPDTLRAIDTQSGVIRINNVVQKPTHPVINQLPQAQHGHQVLQQQTQQKVITQQQLVQHQLQQQTLALQQQHSMLQVHGHHPLLCLQHQASHPFPNSQLVTLQKIQHQNLLHQFSKQQLLHSQQQQQLHPQQQQQLHPQQQQQLHPQQQQQQQQQTNQQGANPPQPLVSDDLPLSLPTDLPYTTRAQYQLPENAIIFCNFNQLYKIDPSTLEMWINILKRVPNSVLWLLKFPAAGEPNVAAMASRLGLPQGRIVFSPVAPKEEHVRRGRLADLCLDTPLCNGHTTGMDVLWAGTPVLTLPLETLASRVASSQLHALGFPELVAVSREDYEEKAVRLGNNPSE